MNIGRILSVFFSLLLAFTFIATPVISAPESGYNTIGLYIARIKKGNTGDFEPVQKVRFNNYKYTDTLTLDDEIRYSWKGAALDLSYKTNPTWGGGYLKVYLNDDSKSTNHIIDYGSSPLPVSKLASKLTAGQNTILMVYCDKSGCPSVPSTKVAFTFDYKPDSEAPILEVVSPSEGAVLALGIDRQFVLKLQNFGLESQSSNQSNKGKMNIYYNSVKSDNLIGTVASSTDGSDYSQVVFNTADYDKFAQIPDSLDTKLIFVLTKTDGELTDFRTELKIKTNYEGSIDAGLPRVTIVEPNKEQSNLDITMDTEFQIQVDNFELLSKFDSSVIEDGKGYMQIRIDGDPIKDIYGKNSFTLKELGVNLAGSITVEINLTDKNYVRLIPDASDKITVNLKNPNYNPNGNTSQNSITGEGEELESNSWRLIIMVLTVALILGSIAILITKG